MKMKTIIKGLLEVFKMVGYILFPCATRLRLAEIENENLRAERDLARKQAGEDSVTLLANRVGARRSLIPLLSTHFRFHSQVKLSIIRLDLSELSDRSANHDISFNRTLVVVANILRTQFRRGSDIVCRLQNDAHDFNIVLVDTNRVTAQLLAEQIMRAIEDSDDPALGGGNLRSSIKFGVADLYAERKQRAEAVLANLLSLVSQESPL